MADKKHPNNTVSGMAWSERGGSPTEVPDADTGAPEAEAHEAAAHTPDSPTGRRGDLGDSGPGED